MTGRWRCIRFSKSVRATSLKPCLTAHGPSSAVMSPPFSTPPLLMKSRQVVDWRRMLVCSWCSMMESLSASQVSSSAGDEPGDKKLGKPAKQNYTKFWHKWSNLHEWADVIHPTVNKRIIPNSWIQPTPVVSRVSPSRGRWAIKAVGIAKEGRNCRDVKNLVIW